MKRYINTSLLYAILAMCGGVFYREFTKFHNYTSQTSLKAIHPHYFLLGMAFFLLLLLLEKYFTFTTTKTHRILAAYHIGLNLTALMLTIRGVTQVLKTTLSPAINASISGIAGIAHITLSISLILLLIQIKQNIQSTTP